MNKLKHVTSSAVASKVLVAGVMALGVTVAVSTYAAGPGDNGSIRIEAKQQVVERQKVKKKWKEVTVEKPFKSVKSNPVKFSSHCEGDPGKQKRIMGGALKSNGSKEIKLPFKGRTQRFTCKITLQPPIGFRVKDGSERNIVIKNEKQKVTSFMLEPAPSGGAPAGVSAPKPGKGSIQLNMPGYEPDSDIALVTAFRNGPAKCEQTSPGGFVFPVSGPFNGKTFDVPLPEGDTDSWYFGYNPTPTSSFTDCDPGAYEVLVRTHYYSSPTAVRDQLRQVTVTAGQTAQASFQFYPSSN